MQAKKNLMTNELRRRKTPPRGTFSSSTRLPRVAGIIHDRFRKAPISLCLFLSLVCAGISATAASRWTVEDTGGALGQTKAPVAGVPPLKKGQIVAARSGRLGLTEPAGKAASAALIPVQWEPGDTESELRGVWLMSPGAAGRRQFEWRERDAPFASIMQARQDVVSGQIDISDDGKPVLRYNYKAIEPGDVLDKVTAANRIYARARSDYIHPLFGLNSEILTRDWSIDHPHHRGIYWAWPEVDFGQERGDLHALQKVFARPTGKLQLQSGPVFAQIEAENLWLWEDREPIVREQAIIRAYRATPQGRVVDLAFRFVALKEGITVARRGTDKYGGLSPRMATPAAQKISTHTDLSNTVPRRAWSDLSGSFAGAAAPSGLSVLQHPKNPDYPGDWVQYPELSWCQPTFPAANTRYILSPGKPLVLRFRLWVHSGAELEPIRGAELWDAFNASAAALPIFDH